MKRSIAVIYFSKDRPLQLDLTLKTNKICSENFLNETHVVLYKASNERFEEAYKKLASSHSEILFIKQNNFKEDLLNILSGFEYVLFVVDDTIFVRKYSTQIIINSLLRVHNPIGFSLRLGKNTKFCYPIDDENIMPDFEQVSGIRNSDNILFFMWVKIPKGDFGYPVEVSSSFYRYENIKDVLIACEYDNPNMLEWALYINLNYFSKFEYLLCYETSVAFSNPINKVNIGNNNRDGGKRENNINSLLEEFEKGNRLQDRCYYGFVPNGCHQEVELCFCKGRVV